MTAGPCSLPLPTAVLAVRPRGRTARGQSRRRGICADLSTGWPDGTGDHRVMIAPEGHPFCLCLP